MTPKVFITGGSLRGGLTGALLLAVLGVGSSAAADAVASKPLSTPGGLAFIVRQQLDATVSDVDAGANVLRLKTETGRLSLDTTGAPATQLKRGDPVVLDVVLIRHAEPRRLPRPHEDPPALLTQRVGGSIAAIHRTLGIVTISTPAGRVTLELPTTAMAGLHTGNPVAVELAVRRQPDVSALPGSERSQSKKGVGALFLMIFGRTK